jgi:hypothetical protein
MPQSNRDYSMTEKEKITHLFNQYQKLNTETEDYIDTLTAALAEIHRKSPFSVRGIILDKLQKDKNKNQTL